jgi:hypothetical protein
VTSKVTVKSVTDVPTLQAAQPLLKVSTPVIPAGHPNEAELCAALNAAQSAVTSAMVSELVARANFLGSVKNWRP